MRRGGGTELDTDKKPVRKGPSAEVRAQVDEFYGIECVICGTEPLFVELAHTNDQRERSVLGNLIPLCFNANRAIQRATYDSTPPPSGEVEPFNLIRAGHAKFAKGQYPQAYGCYRLASHLFDRCDNVSRAVESLDFSIAALRPTGHRKLLRYTILYTRDYIGRRSHYVAPYWRGDYLNQIALVMMDYRRWDDAAKFGSLAEQLVLPGHEGMYPEERDIKIAAQKRRISCVKGSLDEVSSLLTDAKVSQEKHHDATGLATTLHVETILQLNKQGITIKAWDILERALDLEPKITNKWPLAELHFLRGYVETKQKQRQSRPRALHHLQLSFDLCTAYKIAPEPLRIAGNLVNVDPRQLLEQLGLRPLGELRARDYLPLKQDELRNIVDVVFRLPPQAD